MHMYSRQWARLFTHTDHVCPTRSTSKGVVECNRWLGSLFSLKEPQYHGGLALYIHVHQEETKVGWLLWVLDTNKGRKCTTELHSQMHQAHDQQNSIHT